MVAAKTISGKQLADGKLDGGRGLYEAGWEGEAIMANGLLKSEAWIPPPPTLLMVF